MVRILLSFFTCIMVLPLAQGAEAFPYSDRGRNGMVVSAHLLASQVGVETDTCLGVKSGKEKSICSPSFRN